VTEYLESRREFLLQALAIGVAAALPAACGTGSQLGPSDSGLSGSELRAVWLSLSSPRDLFCEDDRPGGTPSAAGVRRVVELVADGGFNSIFLMVDTWYAHSVLHPEYLPRNPLAAFDAIGELLAVARERKLQVHLAFGIVNKRNNPRPPGIAPDFVTVAGGSPLWRARYANDDGTTTESADNVCLVRAATRQWQAQLAVGLLARYPDVDCFQLEEAGYDTARFCVCDECRRVFQARFGADLVRQVLLEAAADTCVTGSCEGPAAQFKSEHTSSTIEAIRGRVASRQLTWSATVSPDWRADQRLGRDWKRWTDAGWLSFVAPMIYVPQTEAFRQALEQKLLPQLDSGCKVCPGIGVHYAGFLDPLPSQPRPRLNPVEEVVRQIEASREIRRQDGRVCGAALFVGQLLRPADRQLGMVYLSALRAGPFSLSASPPRWSPYRAWTP
jgi:uncharacterized lipoprotein YddW (UPF0748 family)